MPAPPGTLPLESARRFQCDERPEPVGAALFSALMVRAQASPDLAHLGTRALHRAVRSFMASQAPDRDLVSWVIAYADPTGETAVRHVLKERGW